MVGPTGSGKTTLTLLLDCGIRAPDASTSMGDLRDFARHQLPREIAYVSQASFLFDDTVTGNITMGLDVTPGVSSPRRPWPEPTISSRNSQRIRHPRR